MTVEPTALNPQIIEARIARLTARVEELHDLLSDLTDQLHSPEAETTDSAAVIPVRYPDARAWVVDYFALTFTRPLGGEWRWCARWQEHAEARCRLEALWRTWEHNRTDPVTGIAVWLRDHLDHHLPILLGGRGPFASCTPTRHEPLAPLDTTPSSPDPSPLAQIAR